MCADFAEHFGLLTSKHNSGVATLSRQRVLKDVLQCPTVRPFTRPEDDWRARLYLRSEEKRTSLSEEPATYAAEERVLLKE